MMTHKEMIEVIAAHEHGAYVQAKWVVDERAKWFDIVAPNWNFEEYAYRVAPPAKVKMWQWLYKSNGALLTTHRFYVSSFDATKHTGCEVIGPAKWTEIEVDTPQTNTPWA